MSSKLVPVDMFDLDKKLSERDRALLEHGVKAWIGETLGMRPQRRLDEYSDDSQVYLGDMFPEDLEDIVP